MRYKWFGSQHSLLKVKNVKKRSELTRSGLFSCADVKASLRLDVDYFAAMIMVATSIPKEIIKVNTLYVLI